ncbi:hypothetical protein [Streptomyces formicae]
MAERLKDGIPVLFGYIEHRGNLADLRVWCRWCCHWHTRGEQPVSVVTHRIAHCFTPDSPYREGGYWIDVIDTPFSTVSGLVRSATSAQQRAMCAGRISPAINRLRAQPAPGP